MVRAVLLLVAAGLLLHAYFRPEVEAAIGVVGSLAIIALHYGHHALHVGRATRRNRPADPTALSPTPDAP